jgi:hypothetical protein
MRTFAILDHVKPGDTLTCDCGFTCMPGGAIKTVRADCDGLYIDCADRRGGKHYLDGQANERGFLVGLYRV